MAFLVLLPLAGCRTQNCDLVEAELRNKETKIEQLQGELADRDHDLKVLELEIEQIRRCAPKGQRIAGSFILKEITLGRMTGGYDDNEKIPGDDGIQILLEPRDEDGQTVKAAGHLRIDLFEVTPQGQKQHISFWELTSSELRKKWDTPLFGGSGYRLSLPWKSLPTTERVRIVATFSDLQGMKFEVDRDVTIKPPARQLLSHPRTRVECEPGASAPNSSNAEPLKMDFPNQDSPRSERLNLGKPRESVTPVRYVSESRGKILLGRPKPRGDGE